MANLSSPMVPLLVLAAARSAGASNQQILPLLLFASMSRSPMMALVLAAALVRAQAKPTPIPAVIPAVAPGVGPLAVVPAPAAAAFDPADILRPFGMLSFHGLDRDKAQQLAFLLGLNIELEGDGNIVTRQQPGIGKPRRADNLVKLTFGDSRA
jgi:hypothetical protein